MLLVLQLLVVHSTAGAVNAVATAAIAGAVLLLQLSDQIDAARGVVWSRELLC